MRPGRMVVSVLQGQWANACKPLIFQTNSETPKQCICVGVFYVSVTVDQLYNCYGQDAKLCDTCGARKKHREITG